MPRAASRWARRACGSLWRRPCWSCPSTSSARRWRVSGQAGPRRQERAQHRRRARRGAHGGQPAAALQRRKGRERRGAGGVPRCGGALGGRSLAGCRSPGAAGYLSAPRLSTQSSSGLVSAGAPQRLLSRRIDVCSLASADVSALHVESKVEAYDLFGQFAREEGRKARAEEVRRCCRTTRPAAHRTDAALWRLLPVHTHTHASVPQPVPPSHHWPRSALCASEPPCA